MKIFAGSIWATAVLMAPFAAQAQPPLAADGGGARIVTVSDVGGPYAAAAPPEATGPGYGPSLLPPTEVYTVLRENGFSPLGIPQQRGFVYRIGVIDRRGDQGRLVIDARDGRIIRFVPADRFGFNGDYRPGGYGPDIYGPRSSSENYDPRTPLPPPSGAKTESRPPAALPHVASRPPTVPVPKPSPLVARPAPAPAQQSAAVQPKPAEPQTAPQGSAPLPPTPGPATSGPAASPPIVEAKPVPQIAPTQDMPKAQGLE